MAARTAHEGMRVRACLLTAVFGPGGGDQLKGARAQTDVYSIRADAASPKVDHTADNRGDRGGCLACGGEAHSPASTHSPPYLNPTTRCVLPGTQATHAAPPNLPASPHPPENKTHAAGKERWLLSTAPCMLPHTSVPCPAAGLHPPPDPMGRIHAAHLRTPWRRRQVHQLPWHQALCGGGGQPGQDL